MGHSKKMQIELMARRLESQAARLLEGATLLKNNGYLEMAEQVALQANELIKAIDQLRAVDPD
jgi:hypothetical protein